MGSWGGCCPGVCYPGLWDGYAPHTSDLLHSVGAILLVVMDLLEEPMKIDVYLLAKERIFQNTKRDDEKNIL